MKSERWPEAWKGRSQQGVHTSLNPAALLSIQDISNAVGSDDDIAQPVLVEITAGCYGDAESWNVTKRGPWSIKSNDLV